MHTNISNFTPKISYYNNNTSGMVQLHFNYFQHYKNSRLLSDISCHITMNIVLNLIMN